MSSRLAPLFRLLKRFGPLRFGCVALLVACSPAMNWRDMPGDAGGLMMRFPCKPDRHVRQVVLPEGGVTMTLRVCSVGELTFALSETEAAEAGRVPIVLEELKRAVSGKFLKIDWSSMPSVWPVPGATPQARAGRWRAEGALSDGRVTQMEMGLTSYGTRVIQLSVSGPMVAADDAAPFFDGVRFQRP